MGLQKCVSFSENVEYAEYAKCISSLLPWWGVCKFEKHSIYSTYSTFPQKEAHFWRGDENTFSIINITAEKSTLFLKNASFSCSVEYVEYVLKWPFKYSNMCFFLGICWICWIYWMFFNHTDPWWGSVRLRNIQCIQHIQHIQHFPRKKHFFGERTKNIFNTFNITAERNTFFEECASFNCNVECCFFGGAPRRVCKFVKHST